MRFEFGSTELLRQVSIVRARHINDYRRVAGEGVPFEGRAFPGADVIAAEHYLGR
jgi:hypothetical protein